MVQGGMTIIRYITFAFNFIFLICGIALIVVGALANSQGRNISIFLGSKLPAASIIVIIAGCVVLALSFLGCCGALKESYCMLMTFSVLLFLLFIVELAAGIVAFIYRNKLQDEIKKNMEDSLHKYANDSDVKKSWDFIQKEFKCCGVINSTDWNGNLPSFPSSCCEGSPPECIHPYTKGCFDKLYTDIKGHAVQLGVAALVIAFIQFLGMVFGCCLAHAIKKEYETV